MWNAVVIVRERQAKGDTGRLSILRDYIRPKRALRMKRATVRFETAPGQQLQSDWAEQRTQIAGQETVVHFMVNTLGFSRRFHFWCTGCEDAEHTDDGLIRSVEWFAGVPAEVVVDHQKAAVLVHPRGGPARFHPRVVDLAGHDGVVPRACQPARAQPKGKDERMVGYIKHHFFVRSRTFESWAHLNQLAEQWLRDEADQRDHGPVQEVVATRFAREAPALQPLPRTRYDTAYRESRQVSWDASIAVRGGRYSVPAQLAGRAVQIRLTLDGELTVSDGEQLAATHQVVSDEPGWVTVPEHHAALWAQTLAVEPRP